eukprot:3269365-Prymnesium_polylepis.1
MEPMTHTFVGELSCVYEADRVVGSRLGGVRTAELRRGSLATCCMVVVMKSECIDTIERVGGKPQKEAAPAPSRDPASPHPRRPAAPRPLLAAPRCSRSPSRCQSSW